jgi:hypothetical protein
LVHQLVNFGRRDGAVEVGFQLVLNGDIVTDLDLQLPQLPLACPPGDEGAHRSMQVIDEGRRRLQLSVETLFRIGPTAYDYHQQGQSFIRVPVHSFNPTGVPVSIVSFSAPLYLVAASPDSAQWTTPHEDPVTHDVSYTLDCHGNSAPSCAVGAPGLLRTLPVRCPPRHAVDYELEFGVTIPLKQLPSVADRQIDARRARIVLQIGDWQTGNVINVQVAGDILDVTGILCHGVQTL